MPTKISWTRGDDGTPGETWNPVLGCSKVSAGCQFCYAIRDAHRLAGNPNPKISNVYKGLTVIQNGAPNWTGEVRLIEERLADPLHWRKPRRVFVNSMSDLWHENLPLGDIAQVYAVMAYCWWHDFQVLTKRPENRGLAFAQDFAYSYVMPEFQLLLQKHGPSPHPTPWHWPLCNVWEGVSVENKDYLWRVEDLLQTPAAVRFVSYEPALGPVNFGPWLLPEHWTVQEGEQEYRHREDCPCNGTAGQMPPALDLIIAGGESGPRARPSHPQWFRDVRDACVAAGVAFHFKQWGEYGPTYNRSAYSPASDQEPASAYSWGGGEYSPRLGKRAAGRLLDGVLHDEFPQVRQ